MKMPGNFVKTKLARRSFKLSSPFHIGRRTGFPAHPVGPTTLALGL